MQNQRLQYERIIITGASSGFGKAFARTLASCTGELVLVARNKEALQQLAAELEEKHPGLRAAALPCDLADESALDNLRFVTPEELSGDMFNKLETWSRLALELFWKRRS